MTQLKARLGRLEQLSENTDNEIVLIGDIICTKHEVRQAMEDIRSKPDPQLQLPSATKGDAESREIADIQRKRCAIAKIQELQGLLGNRTRVFIDEYDAWLTRSNLMEMLETIPHWSASAENQQVAANG